MGWALLWSGGVALGQEVAMVTSSIKRPVPMSSGFAVPLRRKRSVSVW